MKRINGEIYFLTIAYRESTSLKKKELPKVMLYLGVPTELRRVIMIGIKNNSQPGTLISGKKILTGSSKLKKKNVKNADINRRAMKKL